MLSCSCSRTRIIARNPNFKAVLSTKIVPKSCKNRLKRQLLLFGGALTLLATVPTSSCASSSKPSNAAKKIDTDKSSKGSDDDDAVTEIIDKYYDIVGRLGFGGIAGFMSGYAFKKVGKIAAFCVGTGFMAVQFANYYGYTNLNWVSVQKKAIDSFDLDGDGKFDKEDVKIMWKRMRKVLKANLPSGGSFGGGFALGFYMG
mmetsp:Transcript_19351/g.28617  ORF Transcript_19351/g.28617 Transcript_19351/m.28617 type:complete len:201 (+) Transcript_19351:114-716(+)|eukprot:CAMPEP_0171479436 /NCGR_PEP_ID=MMETSP0946-20130122/5427_1 /TAXON_ID=109269 /ORGANISM="Vaucheria litorea, Strain CCMP2940" /LENGTH=200 /DNA_ID=CAMNT_0012010373 /DNA_START=91 /DNA_END=690 /DNA_ORIENTATION=+